MTMPNRKGWLAIGAILFILGIPFALVYYTSSDSYNKRYKNWYNRSAEAQLPPQSVVTADQVMLLKDEKVVVDRTCLVFKNASDNKIKLDLQLLDLDPEQSYPLCILKKDAKQDFWIGNTHYGIVSVNNQSLKLKILDRYHTP